MRRCGSRQRSKGLVLRDIGSDHSVEPHNGELCAKAKKRGQERLADQEVAK